METENAPPISEGANTTVAGTPPQDIQYGQAASNFATGFALQQSIDQV